MMRVALLCLSPLRHDSRVLRHATLLTGAGYEVRIFAQRPLPDESPCAVMPVPGPGNDWRVRLGMVFRQAPATIWRPTADLMYWLSYTRLVTLRELNRFAPEIIIANDWRSLPIAFAAKQTGTRVVYDSHEFASEEFADSWRWNLLARQHVLRIEDRYIRGADAVVTVSEGIANALARRYTLPRPMVIANTPGWQATAFRPTESRITVLYHGAIVPRRGLEALIESVRLWPAHFRLVIRGPAQGGFERHLQQLAEPFGERVTIEPPVPPARLVSAAAQADIGIFLLSNSTTHARFAMPNKIFEYMQAGLMVISSDLPEIRSVIETAGCGALLAGDTPEAIAGCLAGLDPARIDTCKQAALARARDVNFDIEGTKLLALIDRLAASEPPDSRA